MGEEGRWVAPISTAVFTFPCQGLSGAQLFLNPLCPFREKLFDIPVGFTREGQNEQRGYRGREESWKGGRNSTESPV